MTFSNTMDVIIGATSTGWMVVLLGLKFSILKLALPLITFGAILKLLAKDLLALMGMTIAGFNLLFLEIYILQQAMVGVVASIDLRRWSTESILSKLLSILLVL
ncbi:hypothetical protein [Acinetobacter sp. ANC 4173]|uniref:hypothetical protein n=1 Tax=Acinetobacter sp. ANC 4173 TaxID=2529837 RepID=UPI001D0D963E|nr:hypothetical protein [Acinetobacter sp. ANC 4173]